MSTEYFKKALSNFSFEMGSAGEIRVLFLTTRDLNEIKNKLTFKVDDDKIKDTILEYLISKKVILRESDINEGSYEIRKVEDTKNFKSEYIKVKKDVLVNIDDYVKVDFYKMKKENERAYNSFLDSLNNDDKNYIEIIPWEDNMYHIKDERILRILSKI